MASVPGVDYSQGYDVNSLKSGGAQFVCRYIGFTSMSLPQDKIIVYSEAYDLVRAGFHIVSNWEWTADRASFKNTFYNYSHPAAYAGGVEDATFAAANHSSIGGPPTAPIYFSIDYSTDGSDCTDYFRGIVATIGLSRVGAYGPPQALAYLKSLGLITYTWSWSILPSDSQLNPNIVQTATGVKMGKMIVDIDTALTDDYGQWTIPGNLPAPKWFQYPIVVPFGNANYDAALGGSHDLDVKPPPNYPVESIVAGVISDISSPTWGMQLCVKMDAPFQGHEYFGYLHLSAVNPALKMGQRINIGDLVGWVGGANNIGQYMGTNNPTGHSFVDSSDMSSQIQIGIALHDGPAYGGAGWVNFPPILTSLDPSGLLQAARIGVFAAMQTNFKRQQFEAVWLSTALGVKWHGSGLYNARLQAFLEDKLGACTPTQDEQTASFDGSIPITDWSGKPIKWQRYDDGSHGEWSSSGGHIFDALGHGV